MMTPMAQSEEKTPIYNRLERSLAEIKKIFGSSADLNIVRVRISGIRCAVLTLEGMVSSKDLAKMLFDPLMEYSRICATG